MPRRPEYSTDYTIELPVDDPPSRLRYRINSARGRVTGFVVQLELDIDDRTLAVVRYDCAHGQPHKDVLDATGHVIEKDWLPYNRDRALDQAHRDMRANWSRYREEFLRKMREEQ